MKDSCDWSSERTEWSMLRALGRGVHPWERGPPRRGLAYKGPGLSRPSEQRGNTESVHVALSESNLLVGSVIADRKTDLIPGVWTLEGMSVCCSDFCLFLLNPQVRPLLSLQPTGEEPGSCSTGVLVPRRWGGSVSEERGSP